MSERDQYDAIIQQARAEFEATEGSIYEDCIADALRERDKARTCHSCRHFEPGEPNSPNTFCGELKWYPPSSAFACNRWRSA